MYCSRRLCPEMGRRQNIMSTAKKNAGYYAAGLIEDGQVIGLGTGSTVFYMMEELSRRIEEEGLIVLGVPTSFQTEQRAIEYGIPLTTLSKDSMVDIAIDGADQIDPLLRVIKGRGAAQTRERTVACASEQFIIVADESKCVEILSAPVPVEVIPFSLPVVTEQIRLLGGNPVVREGVKKDGPVISDNGNIILDVSFGEIDNPELLEVKINFLPGVVSCGIFTEFNDMTMVIIGTEDGVSVRTPEA